MKFRDCKTIAYTVVYLSSFLLYSLPGMCQSDLQAKKIDSLRNLATHATHDTAKLNLYHKVADLLIQKNNVEALHYEKLTLRIASSLKDNERVIKAMVDLANYNRQLLNFQTALTLLDSATQLNNARNDRPLEARILLSQAWVYERLHKLDTTRLWVMKGLRVLEEKPDASIECNFRIILGSNIMFREKNMSASLNEYYRAVTLGEQSNNHAGIALAYSNIASNFARNKQFEKAFEYCNKSMSIAKKYNMRARIGYNYFMRGRIFCDQMKPDSAMPLLQHALKIYTELNLKTELVGIYSRMSDIYFDKGQYDLVIKEYEKMIAIDWTENKLMSYYGYIGIAEALIADHKTKLAKHYLDSALSLEAFHHNPIVNKMDADLLYAQIYAAENNYEKAYLHYTRHVNVKDSIASNNTKDKLNEIESIHTLRKKEDEIRILNAENNAKNIQLYALIGFALAMAILIAMIYIRYKEAAKTRKKLLEIDEARSRFFANISHEFRTPLTLIMDPVRKRMENASTVSDKEEFGIIYRNTTRLHALIDQLLDLSKIEAGEIKLNVQPCNVRHLIQVVHSYFILLAESRDITYTLECDVALSQGFIDSDKVEKIVYNILSNAFKFTPEGGCIALSATLENNKLILAVQDTGIGISKAKIPHIFDRFYQGDDSATRMHEGTGIGLALSKELALIHKGHLSVASEEGKGSTFTLMLPVDVAHYKNEVVHIQSSVEPRTRQFQIVREEIDMTTHQLLNERVLPWALVVEDNIDMQRYFITTLENDFRIIVARDGLEAWNKLLGMIPDVIVCDYMMPTMDGRALCQKMKNHQLTSHIPIVMVTARASQESRIEALKSGADVFLTKPFDSTELKIILHNLVKSRKQINALFPGHQELGVGEISKVFQPDADFLSRLKSIIVEHHADNNFGIDQLTEKMGVSRTQFHRKLKAISSKTPTELLREYRLEKAKTLLLAKNAQVSEVAYNVGYRNLSNFTKIFKEYTGATPSEFMTEQNVLSENSTYCK